MNVTFGTLCDAPHRSVMALDDPHHTEYLRKAKLLRVNYAAVTIAVRREASGTRVTSLTVKQHMATPLSIKQV